MAQREFAVVGMFAAVLAGGLFAPNLIAGVRAAGGLFAPSMRGAASGEPAFRYFPNCAAAHAAGVYSIHRGDPGYRERLDRDGDGRACEPYLAR